MFSFALPFQVRSVTRELLRLGEQNFSCITVYLLPINICYIVVNQIQCRTISELVRLHPVPYNTHTLA
jgi:hypothetical protein